MAGAEVGGSLHMKAVGVVYNLESFHSNHEKKKKERKKGQKKKKKKKERKGNMT